MPDTAGAATLSAKGTPPPSQAPSLGPPEQIIVQVSDGSMPEENVFFSQALKDQFDRITAKTEANQALEVELAGYGFGVDQSTYFAIQLNTLVDIVFPKTELGQKMRFAWMELCADRMAMGLAQSKQAVMQAVLGAGGNLPPHWIDEINKQAKRTQAGSPQ